MNANEIRDDVTLPGGTAKIRALSFRQIKEARSISAKEGAAMLAGLSGDVLQAIKDLDEAEAAADHPEATGANPGVDTPENPMAGLDQETVLRYGVLEVRSTGVEETLEPWYHDGVESEVLLDGLGEDDADTLGKAIATLSQRSGAEEKG